MWNKYSLKGQLKNLVDQKFEQLQSELDSEIEQIEERKAETIRQAEDVCEFSKQNAFESKMEEIKKFFSL